MSHQVSLRAVSSGRDARSHNRELPRERSKVKTRNCAGHVKVMLNVAFFSKAFRARCVCCVLVLGTVFIVLEARLRVHAPSTLELAIPPAPGFIAAAAAATTERRAPPPLRRTRAATADGDAAAAAAARAGEGGGGGGGKRATDFRCGASGPHIAWEQFEDNYCDCPNGEDERHSGACSGVLAVARADFTCTAQAPAMHLFASRVNDRICDCCDGSDEFASGVTCVNRCAEAVAKLRRGDAERRAGARARGAYVAAAKRSGASTDEAKWGSDGAFSQLNGKCWSHDAGEYRYRVCPYGRAEQQTLGKGKGDNRAPTSGGTMLIGKGWTWLERDAVAIMRGGTSCPGGVSRTVRVKLICAAMEELRAISEHETCQYLAELTTPAACVSK